jgi:hypothetical protein
MRLTSLRKLTVAAAFGLVALLGTTQVANGQWNRDWEREQRRIQRQQQRQIQQQRRAQRQYERRMYRVYNGYQTDDRGLQILRDAVNRGYQQGYYAGQTGRRSRNYGYNNLSSYRSGTYGYNSYVNSSTYRYYFQQGFQRGYEDGYNSRYQYGYRSNGGLNILGNILSGILNISSY